jgi:methionine--tRNA ligase beta chain
MMLNKCVLNIFSKTINQRLKFNFKTPIKFLYDKTLEDKTSLFFDCELRVGKILEVNDMENSEDIYCLKVDLGNNIRDVGTGLRKHLTHEEFLGKNVIVFCNLKPKKLGEYVSNGMILCAYNETKTYFELLRPNLGIF